MVNQYFKNHNIINLDDIDVSIYKYLPLKYLRYLVSKKELYINKVSTWDDVYENWFLKENFILPNGNIATAKGLIPGVFGQCWTTLKESDAMWRIYSSIEAGKDDIAVKIRTSARKLYDCVYLKDDDMVNVYIGKVHYVSLEKFREIQDSVSPLSNSKINSVLTNSYFLKRNTFEHEQEVRIILLYATDQHEKFGKEALSFSIDPYDLIEEFVIDPRVSTIECEEIAKQLIDLGCDKNKIYQSDLYQLGPHSIRLI